MLKLLKEPLKSWNKHFFGHIETKLKEVDHKLNELDKLGETRALNDAELNLQTSLNTESRLWRTRRCQLLKQYSGVNNLTLKDQFPTITSFNKRRSMIDRITIGNEVLENVDSITEGITNFFKVSYSQDQLSYILLPHGVFKKFSHTTLSILEEIPNGNEIKQAVWSCHPDKAPRYDGFNIRFIKTFWPTIGVDIIKST